MRKTKQQQQQQFKLDDRFSIGDVVRLRSGGPPMTVTNVGIAFNPNRPTGNVRRTSVTCVWFEKDTMLQEKFPTNALKKVIEPA